MSIKNRLERLLENSSLRANNRDYTFAKSLQEAYLRQGRLTPGRRPWLDKLEEKYSAEAVAERENSADSSLVSRLQKLLECTEESSWNRGFAESVLNQVVNGYTLSPKQLEVIQKIESEHSDSAVAEREAWKSRYRDENTGLRESAMVVSKYYSQETPYFRDIVHAILHREEFIPTEAQYNKLVKNKYAQKILVGHNAEPKFPVGTLVQLRANSPRYRNAKAMVVATDYVSPINACAGNKIYQLLPLGEAAPYVVEERYIKSWRQAK